MALLLAACGASSGRNENPVAAAPVKQNPTSTVEVALPTATVTNTLELTATATLSPEEVQELPLEWVEPLYLAIKAVEPEASITIASCVTEEYKEYGECVIFVNWCPRGNCEAGIVIYPFTEEMPAGLRAQLLGVKEAVFGNGLYYALVQQGSFPETSGLFLTDKQVGVIYCMYGSSIVPRKFWPISYFPIDVKVAKQLMVNIQILDAGPLSKSLGECQD